MRKINAIILLFLGLGTAYSQGKDTIVFINFNESDLRAQKKMRLLEARQQNRISDAWDLSQFYGIDSKWFGRYMDKLDKELKKGKINFKFISVPNNSSTAISTAGNCSVTTDFKVEESKSGRNLIIYMTSNLLDKDGKLIIDGDARGLVKKLREQK